MYLHSNLILINFLKNIFQKNLELKFQNKNGFEEFDYFEILKIIIDLKIYPN